MGKNNLSATMALGFADGYEKAKEEFLLGHAAGYAAGYFQESDVEEHEVYQGTVFELAYAEGFIAGSTAYQLSCAVQEKLELLDDITAYEEDSDPDEDVRMEQ